MHLRITNNRHQHSMFSALASNPQVRLGSLTNTRGAPHKRLSILSSQNPCMHVYFCNPILVEMIMNPQSFSSFTAFVGIYWADRKHDFCLQAAGSDQRELAHWIIHRKRSQNGRIHCVIGLVVKSRFALSLPKAHGLRACSDMSSLCSSGSSLNIGQIP